MDLLSTKSSTDDKLKLCQGDHRNSGNVTVTNLEEVHVLNASDIFRVLARGQYRRQVPFSFFSFSFPFLSPFSIFPLRISPHVF